MGVVSGMINKADQPAAEIVNEIVSQARDLLARSSDYIFTASKL
jgi:hypothetical protein